MDRVSFWPRKAVPALRPPPGSVLISIFDRKDGPLTCDLSAWAEVLPLRFHDVADASMGGVELFQPAQAKAIFELLKRHPSCPQVVVHCHHGQSRSAAVALYIEAIYGVPCFEGDKPVRHPFPWANKRVLSLLADADPGA